MLDDRRKPLPEVYKSALRIRGKIVPRRRFGDKSYALGARLDLLKHLRQRDDVNVVIAAVEKPFQVSHMQVDAIGKVGDHADRGNLCAHGSPTRRSVPIPGYVEFIGGSRKAKSRD